MGCLALGVGWAGWTFLSKQDAHGPSQVALSRSVPSASVGPAREPVLATAPQASVAMAVPVAVGAPEDWSRVGDYWPELKSLRWPPANDAAGAFKALNAPLRGSAWQLVSGSSPWGVPCTQRPLLAYGAAHGDGGQFSFIEAHWPQTAQEWGRRSVDVLHLQQFLVSMGKLDASGLDGVMGMQTAYALARFQRDHGIAVTGQPDAPTAYRLSCTALGLAATDTGE